MQVKRRALAKKIRPRLGVCTTGGIAVNDTLIVINYGEIID
jgi:hypothetical protein